MSLLKDRRTWIAAGVIVALIAIVSAIGGGDNEQEREREREPVRATAPSSTPAASPSPARTPSSTIARQASSYSSQLTSCGSSASSLSGKFRTVNVNSAQEVRSAISSAEAFLSRCGNLGGEVARWASRNRAAIDANSPGKAASIQKSANAMQSAANTTRSITSDLKRTCNRIYGGC